MQTCNSILAAFLLPALGIAGVCSNTSLGNGMTCVQSASCATIVNTSSLNCSFGSTPTVNHLIIVTMGSSQGLATLTATDNQSNSYHKDSNIASGVNSISNTMSSAVAATSSGTFTVTASTGGPSTQFDMHIYDISGMATSSVNDATGTANVTVSSTSSTVTTSGTPTVAKELIFSSVSFAVNSTNTAGAGYTVLENDTTNCVTVGCMTDEFKTVTNANSGTQTATGSFGTAQTNGYEAGINTYKTPTFGFSKAKKLLKYESY